MGSGWGAARAGASLGLARGRCCAGCALALSAAAPSWRAKARRPSVSQAPARVAVRAVLEERRARVGVRGAWCVTGVSLWGHMMHCVVFLDVLGWLAICVRGWVLRSQSRSLLLCVFTLSLVRPGDFTGGAATRLAVSPAKARACECVRAPSYFWRLSALGVFLAFCVSLARCCVRFSAFFLFFSPPPQRLR